MFRKEKEFFNEILTNTQSRSQVKTEEVKSLEKDRLYLTNR